MLNLVFTDNTMMTLKGAEPAKRIGEILLKIDKLFSLHADECELDWIYCNFKDLPIRCGRRRQIWFGDDARFIIANW